MSALVSERLDTITRLDFEPVDQDAGACFECGSEPEWRVTLKSPCVHDGEPRLLCALHKIGVDLFVAMSIAEGLIVVCVHCHTPADYTAERL